jgi:hypothetical protein
MIEYELLAGADVKTTAAESLGKRGIVQRELYILRE